MPTPSLTQEQFIHRSRKKHNNKYTYDRTVFTKTRDVITITCQIHGDFQQVANRHLLGSGCPKCARDINRLTTEEFIKRSVIIHDNKYTYEKTLVTYSRDKVIITCRTHGDFQQTANSHLMGKGCLQCKREKHRLTQEEFITRSRKIHNDKYDYSKTQFVRTTEKVIITCRDHGDFEQTPFCHLQGQGCVVCSYLDRRNNFVSQQEIEWLDSLGISSLERQYLIQSTTRMFLVDGYDPSTNTIYLYHGDFWHGNLNRYDRSFVNTISNRTMGELYDATILYENQLRELNYNVVTIWESDWMKIRKQVSAG